MGDKERFEAHALNLGKLLNVLNCWSTTNGEKKAELLLAVDHPARALPTVLKFQQRLAAPSRP